MTNRYLVGNAQTIGCREIQNNYFSTTYNDTGDLLAVLADGGIDHRNGRIASMMAVGTCAGIFTQKFSYVETMQINQFLLDTALKAQKHVKNVVFIGKSPRLSLTMGLFRGQELHYFSVGTNKIFLYNEQNEWVIGERTNNAFSEGKYPIAPKNIIGFLSTGAYINSHPMERIRIIESKTEVFDKAQAIIDTVKKKSLITQLNATALLVEVAK